MTTPLIMLAILIAPFSLVALLRRGAAPRRAAGALGLGLLFLFTASGHFVQAGPMVEMIPPVIPARELLVWLTGVLEIVIAVGLFVPATRKAAGLAAAAVLIGFFPFNVYAALNHTGMGGHAWGPSYLLIRAPLQAILIAWAYGFTIRRAPQAVAVATATARV